MYRINPNAEDCEFRGGDCQGGPEYLEKALKEALEPDGGRAKPVESQAGSWLRPGTAVPCEFILSKPPPEPSHCLPLSSPLENHLHMLPLRLCGTLQVGFGSQIGGLKGRVMKTGFH